MTGTMLILILFRVVFVIASPNPLYSGDGQIEDEEFPNVTVNQMDEMGSNELFTNEFLTSLESNVSSKNLSIDKNNSTLINLLNSSSDITENQSNLKFPTYEDGNDENEEFSLQFDYADYIQDEVQRLLQRRGNNDAVPPPLQNLPHDIPPDRSVAEVLAENTIKDIQYDDQKIKALVQELLSHTTLQNFGEVYSDDSEINEVKT